MDLKFSLSNKDNNNKDLIVNIDNTLVGTAIKDIQGTEREIIIFFNLEILKFSSTSTLTQLFNNNIYAFTIPIDTESFKNLNWIKEDTSSFWFQYDDPTAILSFKPDFLKWNKSVDLLTLIKHLNENLNETDGEFINDYEAIIEDGFSMNFNINHEQNINDEYSRILNTVNQEVEKLLLKNESNYYLTNIFSFPPEIRSSCEQYLIYFSRFLEDMGIEVTSKIDSQPINTFFTITPKNSGEALLKIRELLNVYLSLPETSNLEVISTNFSDVSVQQLISNVYHLKSQLLLANSIIQNKDATIESLKFSNYQKNILLESNSNKITDNEKTLNGLLTINEYEGNGFKINLPEIFRRLKRHLSS